MTVKENIKRNCVQEVQKNFYFIMKSVFINENSTMLFIH